MDRKLELMIGVIVSAIVWIVFHILAYNNLLPPDFYYFTGGVLLGIIVTTCIIYENEIRVEIDKDFIKLIKKLEELDKTTIQHIEAVTIAFIVFSTLNFALVPHPSLTNEIFSSLFVLCILLFTTIILNTIIPNMIILSSLTASVFVIAYKLPIYYIVVVPLLFGLIYGILYYLPLQQTLFYKKVKT